MIYLRVIFVIDFMICAQKAVIFLQSFDSLEKMYHHHLEKNIPNYDSITQQFTWREECSQKKVSEIPKGLHSGLPSHALLIV